MIGWLYDIEVQDEQDVVLTGVALGGDMAPTVCRPITFQRPRECKQEEWALNIAAVIKSICEMYTKWHSTLYNAINRNVYIYFRHFIEAVAYIRYKFSLENDSSPNL